MLRLPSLQIMKILLVIVVLLLAAVPPTASKPGNRGNPKKPRCPPKSKNPFCNHSVPDGPPSVGPAPVDSTYNCEDNNPCLVVITGLSLAHDDPNKFFQCDLLGGCIISSCPTGQVWIDLLKVCNWP